MFEPGKHQILRALLSEARRAKSPADMPDTIRVVDFLEGLTFDRSPANRRLAKQAGYQNTGNGTLAIADLASRLLRFLRNEEPWTTKPTDKDTTP